MEIFHDPNTYKFLILNIAIFTAVGVVLYILDGIDLAIKKYRYKVILKRAISLDKLKNEDIYPLATHWRVKKEQVAATLNFILSDYAKDKDCSDEKLERARKLIQWHQDYDPFSDLPDDIKLQLQQVQKMADGSYQDDILRLSKSLSEIYLSNQRKVKREWFVSRLSLLIGIAGLLCGFFYGFFK